MLHGEFDETAQRELIAEMVGELPFPEGGWRIDPTDHPFAITIGRGDVRLTTRYDEENLGMALFSVMHEAGHGLYEAGQDPALARTPLEKPRSLGLHESQSRLWENWLARGRPTWATCCRGCASASPTSSAASRSTSSNVRPIASSAR